MYAFTEILSGIIRVGPSCIKYGDPFDYSLAFVGDGNKAILKALVNPNRSQKITEDHYIAGLKELIRQDFEPVWSSVSNPKLAEFYNQMLIKDRIK